MQQRRVRQDERLAVGPISASGNYTNIYTTIFRLLTSSSTAQSTFCLLRRLFTQFFFDSARARELASCVLPLLSGRQKGWTQTDRPTEETKEAGPLAPTSAATRSLVPSRREPSFVPFSARSFPSIGAIAPFFAPSATIFD